MPAAEPSAPWPERRSRRGADSRSETTTGALRLAEQAFHLLRATPPADLCLYYLGTVPFVLSAFYFWAHLSRASLASPDAAFAALLPAFAYLWMKYWQTRFCRRLWEKLQPSGARIPLSLSRQAREFAAQTLLHALSLPIRLVSALFLGWTIAFFQNASVLALTQPDDPHPLRRVIALSASTAHANWMQNHLVLGLVLLLSAFIWINTLGAAYLIPLSLKTFLGIESVFTRSPEFALLNTTFLFGTVLVAFLFIDPLLKAIYTLRCFHYLSRSTGADLLSRLDRAEASCRDSSARPSVSAPVIGVILALVTALASPPSMAQDTGQPPPTAEDLGRAIETTFEDKTYRWRLPDPAPDESASSSDRNWLAKAIRDLADSLERGLDDLVESIESFFRDLFQTRDSPRVEPASGSATSARDFGDAARVLFIVIIAAVIGWVAFLLIRRNPRPGSRTEEAVDGGAPIDLESEAIVATQLPEDEWLRLAREQMARGDHRLAIRALFLANLSHLGERGLLKVARFKSNRDYSQELSLKARALPELRIAFQENLNLFERAWYGLHEIGRDAIDRFTRNSQRIARRPEDSAQAPRP